MIDDQKIIRDHLVSVAALTTLVGSRIYAGRETPPEAWKPSSGACIVFKRRGDRFLGEDDVVVSASYQFKCYGSGGNLNQQVLSSNAVYRALVDALHVEQGYKIMGAQKEAGGDTLVEPGARFPFVLAFFRAQLRLTE